MKKLILILTAAFMMIGVFSLTGLASRREHREHRERERHGDSYRDHDRHDNYEHEDHDHYGRGDDDDRYEKSEHGNRDRHRRHDHRHDHDCDRDCRYYKDSRVSAVQVKEMVSASISDWQAGEGWEKRKKGRIEIIIPLQYRDQTVGKIKVNPTTGKIMPEDAKHTDKLVKISLELARKTVGDALTKMRVGDNVRLGKRGFIWRVPLVYEGMVVERIKVAGNGAVLPNAHMEEQARFSHRKPPTHKGPAIY